MFILPLCPFLPSIYTPIPSKPNTLEERMAQLQLDDEAKAAARAKLRKEEMNDMREQRKRLSVKDFTVGALPGCSASVCW